MSRGPVLYASDFSPASLSAFRKAIKVATVRRSPLIAARTWAAAEAGSRTAPRQHLQRLVKTARKAGARATSLLVDGMPAERIVQAAHDTHAEFLVLGTHGRTGVRRLLLGSVATKVVALARCPVLTVRGR